MFQEIYIIEDEAELIYELIEQFKEDRAYKFKSIKTEELEIALSDIPALIIIHEDKINSNIIELCHQIRNNEDNSITPIIVVTSNREDEHRIQVLKAQVEYYIKKPLNNSIFYYTIKNIIRLMHSNRTVSPLTGLPGNVQIQAEFKKRLLKKEEFSILYIDLDHFKEYNDTYGFSKGDEVIKLTARTIAKSIHNRDLDNTFIGHIGGDDFIAIVPRGEHEKVCQDIICEFDAKIIDYFSKEDIERGYLEVPNRRGIIEEIPLTSVSIGVVEVDKGRFKNTLEIGEVGAQVKHVAKSIMGSSYAVNRRKTNE